MDYLLTPPEKTDLALDPQQIRAAAEAQWPDAKFSADSGTEANYQFEWEVSDGDSWLQVGFHANGQGFGFSGHSRPVAEAVIWARKQVPDTYGLVFYDQGYSFDVEVTPALSLDHLIEVM